MTDTAQSQATPATSTEQPASQEAPQPATPQETPVNPSSVPAATEPTTTEAKAFSSTPPGTVPPASDTPPQQPASPIGPSSPTGSSNKTRWYHISKSTIVLIVILGGIAGFLFYLALSPKNLKQTQNVASVPTPTPYAQSTLTLEKALDATGTAQLTKKPQIYNVVLTTNANAVNAVQLELGFDPQVINVSDITAGPFVSNPVQLTKDINNKTGRISYAIGVGPNDKPVQGQGVVATITFTFTPAPTVSSTTISFLPKTLIAASGVNPSVLKSTTDITIPVSIQTTPVAGTTGTLTPAKTSPTPLITQ